MLLPWLELYVSKLASDFVQFNLDIQVDNNITDIIRDITVLTYRAVPRQYGALGSHL